MDSLAAAAWDRWNHPSLRKAGPRDAPPGLSILKEYHEKGFVQRFISIEAANAAFGSVVVSPLGLVSKMLPDGTWKHRIVHDLRRGGPNTIAACWERVVLPRPVDHGWDLFDLREAGAHRYGTEKEQIIFTLICDFRDAFMSVPQHASAVPFTVAVVGDPSSPSGVFVFVGRHSASAAKLFLTFTAAWLLLLRGRRLPSWTPKSAAVNCMLTNRRCQRSGRSRLQNRSCRCHSCGGWC